MLKRREFALKPLDDFVESAPLAAFENLTDQLHFALAGDRPPGYIHTVRINEDERLPGAQG